MIQSIKYKAITFRGKTVYVTDKLNVPDFVPIKENVDSFLRKIKGFENWSEEKTVAFKKNFPSTYTVKQQIDDYLLELDKQDFMAQNDLQSIIDWRVVSSKNKQIKPIDKVQKEYKEIIDFMNSFLVGDNQKVRPDFEAAYTVLGDSISGLPLTKKVEIVLNSIKMAGDSVNAFINRLRETERRFKKDAAKRKELRQLEFSTKEIDKL